MVEKIKLGFALLLLVVILSGLAFAYTTEITVTTMPDHDVEIKILDPLADQSNLLESFNGSSGSTGRAVFTYTGSKALIDVTAILRRNGRIVQSNGEEVTEVESHPAGTSLDIELMPGGAHSETDEEQEETAENNTNETADVEDVAVVDNETANEVEENETVNVATGITGGVTSQTEGTKEKKGFFFSNLIYFIIIGGFIALLVIGFILKNTLSNPHPHGQKPENIRVKKYSELKKEQEDAEKERGEYSKKFGLYNETSEGHEDDTRLMAAEHKIREAQEEINEIRNKKKKMQEAQRKFKEAQEELDKLKKEEENN